MLFVVQISGPALSRSRVQCPVHCRFGAMASRLFSTPTKSKTTRGPVVTDPQPKLRQLSLRMCLQRDLPDTSSSSTPEKPKRQYKTRGTGGTFGGMRPPKKLHRKPAFEQRRETHQAELHVKKATQSKSYTDRAYHKFVKEMLPLETDGSSRDRFLRVVQKWKSRTTQEQSAAMAVETAEGCCLLQCPVS